MAVRQIILTIHHELAIGVDENRLNELYETELRPFIRLFYARQEWVLRIIFVGRRFSGCKYTIQRHSLRCMS